MKMRTAHAHEYEDEDEDGCEEDRSEDEEGSLA